MRIPNLFSLVLIIRGSLRALAGEPADLSWTLASQAARRRARRRPPATAGRTDKRTWYPRH